MDSINKTIDDSISSKSTSLYQKSKRLNKTNLIKLANQVLNLCRFDSNSPLHQLIPKKIESIDQISSDLFVFFYENICNTELIGKK